MRSHDPQVISLHKLKGFTLIEVAIVLVIIGVIVSTAQSFYRGTIDSAELVKIESQLKTVNLALITFAIQNKRLPCADTNGNGYEGNSNTIITCGAGSNYQTGAVPYKSLGMNQMANTQTDLLKRNIIYGVYRNSSADADLSRNRERTGDLAGSQYYQNNFDFIKALSNAINATKSGDYVHTTGETPATENCGTFINENYAYILVSAGIEDTDNNGNVFDGVNDNLNLNGSGTKCFSSALKRKNNRYDDVVMVMNFQSLIGRLNNIN